jgi:archaellum biogenesis protein FlaJ (TadC family)
MRNRPRTAAAKANDIVSWFQELKRRNVFRVGIAYLVASWLLLQITDILVPILDLPESAARLVFLLLVIGLIPALIFAWAFELTPDGIKRERDVDRNQSVTSQTRRKRDRIIIGILVAAVIVLLVDRMTQKNPSPSCPLST